MKTSQAGLEFIKKAEGVRLEAYDDGIGVATIGVGHVKGVKFGDRATPEQVDQWLSEDLEEAENALNASVKVELTQNQFDALVSWVFNVGAGAMRSSTLLKVLNQGLYEEAANQLLRWDKAGGRQMRGLTRRREAERALFLS